MDFLTDTIEFFEHILLIGFILFATPFVWTICHIAHIIGRKPSSRALDAITIIGGFIGYGALLGMLTAPPSDPQKNNGMEINLVLTGYEIFNSIADTLILISLIAVLVLSFVKPEKLPKPLKIILFSFTGAGVVLQILWLIRFTSYYWQLYNWGVMTLITICMFHFNHICTAAMQLVRYLRKSENSTCSPNKNIVQ